MLLSATAFVMSGAPESAPTVKAEIDSATLLMGKTTRLTVTVDAPEKMKIDFPLLAEGQGRPYIPLLNDTVELYQTLRGDTMLRDGRRMINYRFLLQSFDSGAYRLPPFEVIAGEDTILSNRLDLSVIPVKVKADDKIDDFTHVAGPFEKTIPEGSTSEKSWLARYWWLLLLTLAALLFVVWAYRRYRREGTLLPVKKEVPPYEAAMESLRKLRERRLCENGREKDYYTALTKILRVYLVRRFGINAMEMTSSQIMKALKAEDDLRRFRPELREVLGLADIVKFAKVCPSPAENEKAFDNVRDFVEQTRPVETSDENAAAEKGETPAAVSSENKKGGEQ